MSEGRKLLRFLLRCARLLVHLSHGLVLAGWVAIGSRYGWVDVDAIARNWLQRLMKILSLRVIVHGPLPPAGLGQLIVCNHVSWLDIPVLGAGICSRFVAKSEIQHWPIAGAYAKAIGTFFIRRGAGGAKPLLEKLRPYLQQGGALVLFPEGTTTNGSDVLPFHPRLFQAALDSGCSVQPVAIQYGLTPDGKDIAPFIGDDDLASHIVRMLKSPGLTATLSYCLPLDPASFDNRQSLALAAENLVRKQLAQQSLTSQTVNAVWEENACFSPHQS
jgi:1-acyl-sn-glycerol-3-phosphate acyltransferase